MNRESATDAARFRPEVGDPLPALTGYDAKGDTFEFSRLKGKHTVIVFGCLT